MLVPAVGVTTMPDIANSDDAFVHVRTYAVEQAAHTHPFHQIVLPLAGRLELEVHGRVGHVADLSSVFVPAGQRHSFAGYRENRVVVLDIPQALADEVGAGEWLERRYRDNFFLAPHRVMRFAALLADDATVEKSAAEVHRAWATLMVRAVIAAESRHCPAAVDRALRFIDARAFGPWQVADVARAAGVSTGHLHALFRTHIGRTPRDVMVMRRLDAARALLAETDEPIAEIALRCGFADQASFTHVMRRVLGTTPGRLRKLHASTVVGDTQLRPRLARRN